MGIVAAPALLLAAGGALFVARRNAKQRRELEEELDQVEAGLGGNEKGYLALVEFLPWAAQILDYIAVMPDMRSTGGRRNSHRADPMGRSKPGPTGDLQDFVTIAATESSVITINVQGPPERAARQGEPRRDEGVR